MGGPSCMAVGLLFIIMSSIAGQAEAYQNHTVGGTAGWFFDAQINSSVTDYTKWASSQNFSLGDYLIFKSNSNHSIIQTYNATTYDDCSYDYSQDDDTIVWLAVDPTKPNPKLTVAVPLTIEGMNYFFSSARDGIECDNGMKFEIGVSKGQGLPPNLRQPPPPPFSEESPPPAEDSPSLNPGLIPKLTNPAAGSGSQQISCLNAAVLYVLCLALGLVIHLF